MVRIHSIHKSCFLLLAAFFCLHTAGNQALAAGDQEITLDSLVDQHPRLIATDERLEQIREIIKSNETAKKFYSSLKEDAEKLLEEPPVEYVLAGPRLLSQSRRCLSRIYILALIYRLDGDTRFLERAKTELNAAAAFPDWNPSHFLDTAEMTHAFGIGLDWLYNSLNQDERDSLQKTIIEKGIKPYLEGFENDVWWTKAIHNWNQVCHGGIGIGALAIADKEPALAKDVLTRAVRKLPDALAGYAPDGGWNEGPGYWHYATRYTVYFLSALETALGKDFGLSDSTGFNRAGHFRVYFTSPIGEIFNFADASGNLADAHEMFWLTRRFNEPVYAWHQLEFLKEPTALDLVWFRDETNNPQKGEWPLDAYFKGIDVIFLRSAWDDPNATFIGFKGGDNKANHSHLDLGSFVMDADGVRWAVDLGSDNYNLPGYFSKDGQRWTYYRLNTQSHNTLLIDGLNQDTKAHAPILQFKSKPQFAYAITDLSEAYGAAQCERGVAMLERRHILIQDEVKTEQPADITWNMLTAANVEIDGNTATLTQDSKVLQIRILSPENGFFKTESANPPEPQGQQDHIKKLVVGLPEKTSSSRISILMSPGDAANQLPAFAKNLIPLAQWGKQE